VDIDMPNVPPREGIPNVEIVHIHDPGEGMLVTRRLCVALIRHAHIAKKFERFARGSIVMPYVPGAIGDIWYIVSSIPIFSLQSVSHDNENPLGVRTQRRLQRTEYAAQKVAGKDDEKDMREVRLEE
jgi:hypothetical protein